ncbi:hypothetical protein 9F7_82 [uncultured Caudovirales phage]|uniref:Uncharacterized protein n=1 Tax=uncultured Caudovirales phage TaxID=2100421 RepID=A0A2H4J7W7_9CAUD|nr:hypothetical protein 3S4_48 [uncultured Caudovirales phage]ASN68371.1 hypothetical protein 3F6_30 [uncultured Caudovirales phage]ASN68519.1 hypothetical protein 9F7_82 [uncultured Caudovirales phage]ASN68576.1 hypothetical protein 8S7_43 [uncultured Caudovirales phage]ASN72098.1 hypothetical protein 7F14_30 [uncultured Caudovirales phage]
MPTENRSSNTEMVSVLHREDRYIVIKRSDLDKIPGKQRIEFSKASRVAHERMYAAGAPARQFLVIESDWPEYELAWASIEARVLGAGAAPLMGSRLLELHSSELRAARMEIATLRAQLAERDALLDRLRNHLIAKGVLDKFGPELFQILNIEAPERAARAALSASAEPSAPAAQSDKCLDGGDCGIGGTCKWCPHTSASPAQQPS